MANSRRHMTNVLFFNNDGPTELTWIYRLDMPDGIKHFSKTKPMELQHFAPAVAWWKNRKVITVDGFDKAWEFSVGELIAGSYNLDLCGYPHEEEEIKPSLELIADFQKRRAELNAKMDAVLAEIQAALGESF